MKYRRATGINIDNMECFIKIIQKRGNLAMRGELLERATESNVPNTKKQAQENERNHMLELYLYHLQASTVTAIEYSSPSAIRYSARHVTSERS